MVTRKEMEEKGIEENGAIRKEIIKQFKKGLLNMIHVVGLPGTGKSWYCLRLAEQLYEDIHGRDEMTADKIHHKVVDSLLGLLRAIRRVNKPGDIIICEEIGVWLSSKRAMASENVDAGYVFDTIRKKRIIIIGNNPISDDTDKKMRRLSSLMIQTLTLNKKQETCVVKALRLQTNPDSGKTYRHRLREDGFDVHRCWSGPPKEELTEAYENMKDKFLDELYYKLEKKHKEKDLKENPDKIDKVQSVTETESRRYKMRLKGMTFQQIADIEGVNASSIQRTVDSYKRKLQSVKDIAAL